MKASTWPLSFQEMNSPEVKKVSEGLLKKSPKITVYNLIVLTNHFYGNYSNNIIFANTSGPRANKSLLKGKSCPKNAYKTPPGVLGLSRQQSNRPGSLHWLIHGVRLVVIHVDIWILHACLLSASDDVCKVLQIFHPAFVYVGGHATMLHNHG